MHGNNGKNYYRSSPCIPCYPWLIRSCRFHPVACAPGSCFSPLSLGHTELLRVNPARAATCNFVFKNSRNPWELIEMPHDANEPLPVPNSESEYFNGVADDGSPLRIVSAELIPPREPGELPPPIGPDAAGADAGKPKTRFHIEAEKKILAAQREHIERVRKCVRFYESLVDLGAVGREILALEAEGARLDREIANLEKQRHLERMKLAPVGEVAGEGEAGGNASGIAGCEATSRASQSDAGKAMSNSRVPRLSVKDGKGEPEDCVATQSEAAPPESVDSLGRDGPDTHCRDGNATHGRGPSRRSSAHDADGTSALRGPREPRAPKFSAALLISLALRAAKELPSVSALLCELESKLRPAEAEQKWREEFYQDRGVSLISDTLSSMGEAYGQLGFGNWMPFRFLDQWFMFCGILNRVLAAHGLVPSGNAAVYRKLLEDTPSISLKAKDAGPPKSWGLAYRTREIRHMEDLLARIAEVRTGRGPP
ncbi:MAG TPA: hypothetical protein VHO25_23100, partial [Polyangiaceae bacterium]|nr:hypothetical protein [Polyangiaceae bacterium]